MSTYLTHDTDPQFLVNVSGQRDMVSVSVRIVRARSFIVMTTRDARLPGAYERTLDPAFSPLRPAHIERRTHTEPHCQWRAFVLAWSSLGAAEAPEPPSGTGFGAAWRMGLPGGSPVSR